MNKNSTFFGRMKERMADAFGFQGDAERRRLEIQSLDDKVNMGTNSSFSLAQSSKIYNDIISLVDNIEEIVKGKFNAPSLNGDADIYRKRVIYAKAELESRGGNYAEKYDNYLKVLHKSLNDYVRGIANKEIIDYDVLIHYNKIVMIVNNYKSLFRGIDINLSDYDGLKKLVEDIYSLKSSIDNKIYNYNTRKTHLENLDSTREYYNNREAVDKRKKR